MYEEIFQMLVNNHALIIERLNKHIKQRTALIRISEDALNKFRIGIVDASCPVKPSRFEFFIENDKKSIIEAEEIKEDYLKRMIENYKIVKNNFVEKSWTNYVFTAADALNVYNIQLCYQRSYIEKIAALQTEIWNKTEKWFTINKE